jgi:phosphoribosylaminoimidazole-succinocarboxamide synthase
MASDLVLRTELSGLGPVRRGKVRDVYDLGEALLIVTTDRISAFDHVLPTGIPGKGRMLTAISAHWFRTLGDRFPHHLIATDLDRMPPAVRAHAGVLEGRCMFVHKARVYPVEWIVRGFLLGSLAKAWRTGGPLPGGVKLPAGIKEGDPLPEPLFTPTTKAESGHDLPITIDELGRTIGAPLARRLGDQSVALFRAASAAARARGVILCDTKFEWGERNGEPLLVDEVLTPDSSRFLLAGTTPPGQRSDPYDKQVVRDFLEKSGWDKESAPPPLPPDVVAETARRYAEICRRITGSVPGDAA